MFIFLILSSNTAAVSVFQMYLLSSQKVLDEIMFLILCRAYTFKLRKNDMASSAIFCSMTACELDLLII